MKTIYKYRVADKVEIPASAQILHYGIDPNGIICLWALIDTEEIKTKTKEYVIIGTGWPLDEMIQENECHYNFVATVNEGLYMWHIFEKFHLQFQSFTKFQILRQYFKQMERKQQSDSIYHRGNSRRLSRNSGSSFQ